MNRLNMTVVESSTTPSQSNDETLGTTRIKVIGAGGGGCNAIDHMIRTHIEGVDFVAINTDMQALSRCLAPQKIALGQKLTGGLGAGGNPDVGSRAAQEDKEAIRQVIDGAHMVFLTTGLGGGTGTGSLPIVASLAKESGALTVAIVTLPFSFEGARKMNIAREGLEELRKNSDALIVVPNQKLLEVSDHKATFKEAFAKVDNLLCIGVKGVVDLITNTGYLNVDFADVRKMLSFKGEALMGMGIGKGDNRAIDALKAALNSPLVENNDISGAHGLLVNITAGTDFGIYEGDELMSALSERISENTERKMGLVIDENLIDEVHVTIIATGFNREEPRVIERGNRTFTTVGGQKPKPVAPLEPEITDLDTAPHRAMQSRPAPVHSETFAPEPERTPSARKANVIDSNEWESITKGRRQKNEEKIELDESVPSYLRHLGEGF
ncbi:cell division protein FtsZ [Entomospira culicis]|uniref:Cell division protein FtsZ n=1 Tax=Entomospira culicis TaxID=2719989 RepID=A0A968KVY7_9SPIO|nr:cell division protein FtsZ [Entomospira culicis]NIZ19442.1 cell division protein FtsZ [Entomospira culicis]NIZ69653.1 cell division protein FtsZ [Entomospira culicis]WDI36764.1 cell division protein FtsZ [Entomospira culicis]WDI38393.1 cell division protein FtsZ [Entomospira culicis]